MCRYSFSTRCCSLERSARRSRGLGRSGRVFISTVHLARLEFVNPLSTLLLVTLFILLIILAKLLLGELVAPESRVYVGDLVCGIASKLSLPCVSPQAHAPCVQQHPGVLVSELLWV